MTLRYAGEARRDPHGGGVLLDVGGDPYLVRSFHLKALLLRDINQAAILRRYPGRYGGFVDVETGSYLLRSRSGRGLKFWTPNGTFVMSRDEMIAVVREKSDAATISLIVTDADQLSDATSRQTALGGIR